MDLAIALVFGGALALVAIDLVRSMVASPRRKRIASVAASLGLASRRDHVLRRTTYRGRVDEAEISLASDGRFLASLALERAAGEEESAPKTVRTGDRVFDQAVRLYGPRDRWLARLDRNLRSEMRVAAAMHLSIVGGELRGMVDTASEVAIETGVRRLARIARGLSANVDTASGLEARVLDREEDSAFRRVSFQLLLESDGAESRVKEMAAKLLDDLDPAVRFAAARLSGAEGIPVLESFAADTGEKLRRRRVALAEALARAPVERASVLAASALISESEPELVSCALRAIRARTLAVDLERACAVVRKRSFPAEIRAEAVRLLTERQLANLEDELLALVRADEDDSVVIAALEGLGTVGSPETIARIRGLEETLARFPTRAMQNGIRNAVLAIQARHGLQAGSVSLPADDAGSVSIASPSGALSVAAKRSID